MTEKVEASDSQLTDEQLAQLVAERLRARVEACGAEIAAVLERYKCTMQSVFEIRQGNVSGRIEITPLPPSN